MISLPSMPDDCTIEAQEFNDSLVLSWPKGIAYQPPWWLTKVVSVAELGWIIGGGYLLWLALNAWFGLFLGILIVWIISGGVIVIALRIYWRERRPAVLTLTPKTLTFDPFRTWGSMESAQRLLCAKAGLSFEWAKGELLLLERDTADDIGYGLDEVDQEWLYLVLQQWLQHR